MVKKQSPTMLKVNITLMRIEKSPDKCKKESQNKVSKISLQPKKDYQIMTGEQNHRRVELEQETIKLAA
jgi:hypothetical protein